MRKTHYKDLPKHLRLTRADVLKNAQRRPLRSLRWQDLRGENRIFHAADTVVVIEGAKAKIMKDRQGELRHYERDEDGLASSSFFE